MNTDKILIEVTSDDMLLGTALNAETKPSQQVRTKHGCKNGGSCGEVTIVKMLRP